MRFARPLRTVLIELSQSFNRSVIQQYLTPRSHFKESEQTPILFMHGFSSLKAINFLGYEFNTPFNAVNAVLNQFGYLAFTPNIPAIESAEVRTSLWAEHIQHILDTSGAKQVHIIAHGQGAIDARILACARSSSCNNAQGQLIEGKGLSHRIASITSLAGPHLGTPVLDHLESKEDKAKLNDLIDYLALINLCSPQTIKIAFENISPEYMLKEFNPCMLMPNTIPCYTIAASPLQNALDKNCLQYSWLQLKETASFDGGGDNDGLVPVNSAHFVGNNALLAGTKKTQWQNLGSLQADHFSLTGYHVKSGFEYLPFFTGLAQYTDPLFHSSQDMTLLPNGQWQRKPISPKTRKPSATKTLKKTDVQISASKETSS